MRRSTIEQHVDRERIEAAIRNGESHRSIAKQFNISPAAVQRYSAGLKQVQAIVATAPPGVVAEIVAGNEIDALGDLKRIRDDLLAIQQESSHPSHKLYALDKQIRLLDTLVKVAAEARQRETPFETLIRSPEFRRYERAVIAVLRTVEGASQVFAEAFERDSRTSSPQDPGVRAAQHLRERAEAGSRSLAGEPAGQPGAVSDRVLQPAGRQEYYDFDPRRAHWGDD